MLTVDLFHLVQEVLEEGALGPIVVLVDAWLVGTVIQRKLRSLNQRYKQKQHMR